MTQPREVTTHKSPGLNDKLTIYADVQGNGGASHEYRISWQDRYGNTDSCDIRFQEGGINELVRGVPVGINGVSIEALLAIGADRLLGFQSGEFACGDNVDALNHILKAIECLHKRTKGRVERGVEGTHQK
jgi:hypothetical protein